MQQITTHATDALARLLQKFKGKANTEKLFNAFNLSTQRLEDALFTLTTIRNLDTISGVNLDAIGRIVGLARDTLVDADYRTALKAQIKVLRSSGTASDLFGVIRALLGLTPKLVLEQAFPAGFTIRASGSALTASLAAICSSMLRRARGAAIRALFEWSPGDDASSFTFAIGAALVGDHIGPQGSGNTIHVDSTVNFPTSGSLILGYGGTTETVVYAAKTATSFTGCGAYTGSYADATLIVLTPSVGLGFGDTGNPSTGGVFAGVFES